MRLINKVKVKKARRKKGIPMSVKPTGRVIDMTKSIWGWSLCKWEYDAATDTVRTGGWCSPRPQPGDILEVAMKKGDNAQVICLTVEHLRDPDDMWWANVQAAPADTKESS